MAECSHDRKIRGLARFDEQAMSGETLHELLGQGRIHYPGKDQRYQGVVPRKQQPGRLPEVLGAEQIATNLFLFADGDTAAGLLLQRGPATPRKTMTCEPGKPPGATVEAEELLKLDSETLLHRCSTKKLRLYEPEPVEFRAAVPANAPWRRSNRSARKSATAFSTNRAASTWTASSATQTIASIEMTLITFSPVIRYTDNSLTLHGSRQWRGFQGSRFLSASLA